MNFKIGDLVLLKKDYTYLRQTNKDLIVLYGSGIMLVIDVFTEGGEDFLEIEKLGRGFYPGRFKAIPNHKLSKLFYD